MTIRKNNIYQFEIPLARPLMMMNTVHKHRQGFILENIDANGNTSYGEISPFPGLNTESMASSLDNLKSVAALLSDIYLPDHVDSILSYTGDIEMFPSVRFGVETALLNLLSLIKNTSLALLLNPKAADNIRLNALIASDSGTISEEISRRISDGYKTIKIKIGSVTGRQKTMLKSIIDTVNKYNISDNVAADIEFIRIRLDANRGLSLNSAVDLFAGLDTASVEYIEEPLDNILHLKEFCHIAGVPAGLDETITEDAELADYYEADYVSSFIVKPTAIGSYRKMADIYEKASASGKKVVISSCFESGVGLKALINIAAAFNRIPTAAGLDTYKWLKEDIQFASFVDFGPEVSLEKINSNHNNLNMNLLNKVSN